MSSGHPLQEANEVLQTTLDEKDPFSSMHGTFHLSERQKMEPSSLLVNP
jgi:hypothetical protein